MLQYSCVLYRGVFGRKQGRERGNERVLPCVALYSQPALPTAVIRVASATQISQSGSCTTTSSQLKTNNMQQTHDMYTVHVDSSQAHCLGLVRVVLYMYMHTCIALHVHIMYIMCSKKELHVHVHCTVHADEHVDYYSVADHS